MAILLFASVALAQEQPRSIARWANGLDGAELPEQALLAVGLVIMDHGISRAEATEAEKSLRSAEARYIPFVLRTVLENTRLWGPVRLLPAIDASSELLITGAIIESSGDRLRVRLKAVDGTGRRWLDQEYDATAKLSDYEESRGAEPFLHLYKQIAADLERFRSTLPLRDLARIIEVSRLRYASTLAPEAFAAHLDYRPDGTVGINRLPSATDPMLARIERIRETEYLFIDTVDQHFSLYAGQLGPTYLAWRRLTLEARDLLAAYRNKSESRRANKGKNSMNRTYSELQELKYYQQTLREAIGGFRFEVGPTTLDLNGDLVELTGSLSEQHGQWKSLLSQIYASELGLPLSADTTR